MTDKLSERPLEHCHFCGDATGRAGIADDSIYLGTIGPFCENCYGETGYYALEQRVERLENGLRELSDPVVYEGIPIFHGTKQPWRIAKEALAEEKA